MMTTRLIEFSLSAIALTVLIAVHPTQAAILVGGTAAGDGEYPFIVSIRRFGAHYCTATIVDTNWVLTAGHCIFNQTRETIDVLVGTNDQEHGGVVHLIEQIVLHDTYQYVTDQIAIGDIGLLKLERPIALGPRAQKVSFGQGPTRPDTVGIVSGWGRQSFEQGPSRTLQKLEMSTINNQRCSELLPERSVNNENMCVVAPENKGACFGDSGAPFIKNGKQVGLLSWVVAPCATGQPDGFTRMNLFTNWVWNVVRPVHKHPAHHHY